MNAEKVLVIREDVPCRRGNVEDRTELWEKWRNRATKLVSLMERRGWRQYSEVGRGSIM